MMKINRIFLLFVLAGLLGACATSSSGTAKAPAPPPPPPIPTPASEEIAVLTEDQLPAHYTVVGTIRGYTIEMLQKKARKLGADAIINPTSVDPVSGWATTEAIKYGK